MNKKLQNGLTVSASLAMAMGVGIPVSTVLAASATTTAPASTYGVQYEGHVQNIGWQTPAINTIGEQSDMSLVKEAGTFGKGLRVEALKLTGYNLPAGASITCQAYVENFAWLAPVVTEANTDMSLVKEAGTSGKGLRVEAFKMTLNGMPGYAVEYQTHVQNLSWMAPVTTVNGTDIANAEVAGTHNLGLRMEALRVQIVKTSTEKAAEIVAIDATNAAVTAKTPETVAAARVAVAKVLDTVENTTLTTTLDGIKVPLAVTSVSAINGKTVVVKFTQPVLKSTVVDSTTGHLKNITFASTGTAPNITSANAAAVLSTDGMTLTITPTGTEYFGGDYVVSAPIAVTDINANAITAYEGISTLNDAVRPTISAPTYTVNGLAKFALSEPINASAAKIASAMTVSNVEDGSNVVVAAGDITPAADGMSFTLNMNKLTADKAYTASFVGLEDYAGNLITPNPVTYTITNSKVDTVVPTVIGITVKSDTEFTIQFSEELSAAPTVTLNSADVKGTSPAGKVTVDPLDSTKYNVVLGASGAGLKTIGVSAGYTDLSTNSGAAWSKLVQLTADKTNPSVVSTTVSTLAGKQYLIVKYGETISGVGAVVNALSGSYIDKDMITYNGVNVATTDASLYYADGVTTNPTDSLKIDLSGLNAKPGNYTMTVNTGLANDVSNNPSNSSTANFAVGTLADTTVPVANVVSVQATQDKVLVHFDRSVTAATALNVNNYTIEGQSMFAKAEFIGSTQDVTLTLNPNVIAVPGLRNFTIANVSSVAGVVMKSYTTQQQFVENVKPTIKTTKLATANTITLTFSEAMKVATLTDGGDFTVKVNGVDDVITGVTSSDASTYTVNLTTPIANLGDTVTLTVVPTNNATDNEAIGNGLSTTGSIVVGQ